VFAYGVYPPRGEIATPLVAALLFVSNIVNNCQPMAAEWYDEAVRRFSPHYATSSSIGLGNGNGADCKRPARGVS